MHLKILTSYVFLESLRSRHLLGSPISTEKLLAMNVIVSLAVNAILMLREMVNDPLEVKTLKNVEIMF